MEIPRFYHNPIEQGQILLTAGEAHHFISVLRGKTGDPVELIDGQGGLGSGKAVYLRKKNVHVEIDTVSKHPPRTHNRIILAAAAAKGQRFEWMLTKCTEIGVDHIAIVQFEHSVRLGRESAVERYQNIAMAACKQCGRLYLPIISAPKKVIEVIADMKEQYPNAHLIYGSLENQSRTISQLGPDQGDTVIFIGPEGGFSELELRLFDHYKAVGVRVSQHILRTETAAVCLAAICEALRLNK